MPAGDAGVSGHGDPRTCGYVCSMSPFRGCSGLDMLRLSSSGCDPDRKWSALQTAARPQSAVRSRGARSSGAKVWHDVCSAKNLSDGLARHLADVLADISERLFQLWAGALLQLGGKALHLRSERPVDCLRRCAVTPHDDRGSSRKDLTRRLPRRAVFQQEEEDLPAVQFEQINPFPPPW